MKILVLGASGRTGKWVLEFALEKGYSVNVLVRDSTKISKRDRLSVFEGNALNINDLKEASLDCKAIISVLNISRTSDFPWSKLRTPDTFLSDVMKNVIAVTKELNIKRVITCSAWGVAETNADIPFWFRWTIKFSNISKAYADHERQEKLVEATDLDWTIVRPVGLVNSMKRQRVQVSHNNRPKPKLLIGRISVAEFMVNALIDDSLYRKLPVISAV